MREDIERRYQNISNDNSTKIFFNSDVLINHASGIVYKRIEIEKDGDCGYTAYEITRKEAYVLLITNISTITLILQPVIQEALLTERFIEYMKFHKCASYSLQEAFHNYQREAHQGGNNERAVAILKNHALQLDVVLNYLNYDVRDKMVDDGWAHPCVLQALAHLQSKELYIWQKGVDKTLVPHPGYPYYKSINSIQRVDLLFVNGNHFERLEQTNFVKGDIFSYELLSNNVAIDNSVEYENSQENARENIEIIDLSMEISLTTNIRKIESDFSLMLSLNYIPRKNLLAEIEVSLENKHLAVLSGIGGGGKTQLALGYLYEHAKKYSFVGWIDAKFTEETEYEQYKKMAFQLQMKNDIDNLNLNELIKKIKIKLDSSNLPWLIVYDNVDKFYQIKLYNKYQFIGYANFICTTRKKNITELNNSIVVESFQLEEGLSFLFGAMRNSDEFSKNTAMAVPLNSVFSDYNGVNVVDEVRIKHFEKNDGYMEAEVLEVANNKKNIKEIFCKDDSFMKNSKKLFDKLQGFPLALEAAVKFMKDKGVSIQRFLDVYQFTMDYQHYFDVEDNKYRKNINIFKHSNYDHRRFVDENDLSADSFSLLCKCAYLNKEGFLKKHLKFLFSNEISKNVDNIKYLENIDKNISNLFLSDDEKKRFDKSFEELVNNSIFTITRFEIGDVYAVNGSLQYMLQKYLLEKEIKNNKISKNTEFCFDVFNSTISALYEFNLRVIKKLFDKHQAYPYEKLKTTQKFFSHYHLWTSHVNSCLIYLANIAKEAGFKEGIVSICHINFKNPVLKFKISQLLHYFCYHSYYTEKIIKKVKDYWWLSYSLMDSLILTSKFDKNILSDNKIKYFYNFCDSNLTTYKRLTDRNKLIDDQEIKRIIKEFDKLNHDFDYGSTIDYKLIFSIKYRYAKALKEINFYNNEKPVLIDIFRSSVCSYFSKKEKVVVYKSVADLLDKLKSVNILEKKGIEYFKESIDYKMLINGLATIICYDYFNRNSGANDISNFIELKNFIFDQIGKCFGGIGMGYNDFNNLIFYLKNNNIFDLSREFYKHYVLNVGLLIKIHIILYREYFEKKYAIRKSKINEIMLIQELSCHLFYFSFKSEGFFLKKMMRSYIFRFPSCSIIFFVK